MRQCLLRKKNRLQTAWLPSQYAKEGMWLRIHDEDGWQVQIVHPLWQAVVHAPHGYFAGGIAHH